MLKASRVCPAATTRRKYEAALGGAQTTWVLAAVNRGSSVSSRRCPVQAKPSATSTQCRDPVGTNAVSLGKVEWTTLGRDGPNAAIAAPR